MFGPQFLGAPRNSGLKTVLQQLASRLEESLVRSSIVSETPGVKHSGKAT
jgi:hypothetical protein